MKKQKNKNQSASQKEHTSHLLFVFVGIVAGALITILISALVISIHNPMRFHTMMDKSSMETKSTRMMRSGDQKLKLTLGPSMNIPKDWKVLSNTTNLLMLETATQPFMVKAPVRIEKIDSVDKENAVLYSSDNLSIYENPCAPAIGCYDVMLNGQSYRFTWDIVQSTQPVPEDLDGPWSPDKNFDRAEILEILKSLR